MAVRWRSMATALSSAPTTETLTPAALGRVAAALACQARTTQLPAGAERRWVQLAATDKYDAWLIAWPVGAQLGMHDHGGSSAAMQVVAGEVVERHRELGDGGPDRQRTVVEGAVITFGANHVHAL